MRKIATGSSQRTTLRLVLGGKEESGSASSPFGPVRAGLITMQRTNKEVQLTELLNCLERKITEANIKSYEVLNILLNGTTHLAEPTTFFSDINITDTCDECGNDLPAEGESKCLECLESMIRSNS